MKDYAQTVRNNVSQHGFHVTYVARADSPSFCYSTGIAKTFSIPEVLISALPPSLSNELIFQYVKRHAESGPTVNQRITAVDERFDYYLIPVPVTCLKEYVLATFEFYGGTTFEYLQLIYPDANLLFPDQIGYAYDQEIKGQFPPESAAYKVKSGQDSISNES